MKKVLNQFYIFNVYFLLFLSIIFLVLIPRGVEFQVHNYHVERGFIMHWSSYWENILAFFHQLFFEKTLGINIYGKPVWDDILIYFIERSLPVIIGAFLLSLLFGVFVGTLLFLLSRSFLGKVISFAIWILQSIPDFFLYILIQLAIFQLFRWGLPTFSVYGYDEWYSYLIAMLIVAIFPGVYLALIIYPALEEERNKKYIQTAQSKGVPPIVIVLKHQWSNIINRMVTHLHTMMLIIVGNLIIFEYLFFMRGAAIRVYQALGFHNAIIQGSYRSIVGDVYFETDVIIWFFACFLAVIYVTHTLQSLLSSYFIRKGASADE